MSVAAVLPPLRRAVPLLLLAWMFHPCEGGTQAPSEPRLPAVYRLADTSRGEIFRILLQDDARARKAAQLLASGQTMFVTGRPLRGDGGFNPPWSWHLDPQAIGFAEVTAEACQTWPGYLENNLDYWIRFGEVCLSARVLERER